MGRSRPQIGNDESMKIAICARLHGKSTHPGGGSIVALSLAEFMAHRGHKVSLFGRNTPSAMEQNFLGNYDIDYLKELPDFLNYPLMPIRAFWLLKDKFREFDVVHAHIGSFAFAASRLKKGNRKVKLVVTVHEVGQPKYEPAPKAKLYIHGENLLAKIASKSANAVVVNSHYMKELVSEEWGINTCVVIQNGVDTNLFRPVTLTPEVEKHWGGAEYKLLYVGRMDFRKGVLQLVESIKYLRESGLNVRLLVVGDGKLQKEVENLIFNLKLDKYAYLYGPAKRGVLPYLYSSADLTIVPSIYEPFGLVPLESLACGTPVIVSSNTAMRETIEPSVGYFIPEITPKSIANSIEYAISNGLPSPQSCRKFVCERYDWRDIFPQYEALYREC